MILLGGVVIFPLLTIPQSACSADSPLYTRGPLVRTTGSAGGYDFVGADSISAREKTVCPFTHRQLCW